MVDHIDFLMDIRVMTKRTTIWDVWTDNFFGPSISEIPSKTQFTNPYPARYRVNVSYEESGMSVQEICASCTSFCGGNFHVLSSYNKTWMSVWFSNKLDAVKFYLRWC